MQNSLHTVYALSSSPCSFLWFKVRMIRFNINFLFNIFFSDISELMKFKFMQIHS